MRDETASGSNGAQRMATYRPIPAARSLEDFAWERVGDDLVLFDGETMQYHTLNAVAERIWRACDGAATVESIAVSTRLPIEVVETTVAELGEASLLSTPASGWAISMDRRRAAKLIAAGAVGAVGVPVVASVTAPHAAAQNTGLPNGSTCTASYQCESGCCKEKGGGAGECKPGQGDCLP